MIQTLMNNERFMLGITETILGCHLMQIEPHIMKDYIQGVIERLGIQMKMTSWFVWQEVAILMKKEALRKAHLMHCVSFFSDALFKFLLPAPEVHM